MYIQSGELRQTTVDQRPGTQLYDLRSLAEQHGFEIVKEYTDKISGVKAKRAGLDQLLADARRRRFDLVIVWAFDRIAFALGDVPAPKRNLRGNLSRFTATI